MNFEELLNIPPYSLDKKQKEELLTARLTELTEHHINRCASYSKMLKSDSFDLRKVKSYYDLPFLPVRLFKELELKSITDEEVVKTMTSSGTSGQQVSKIYLDKDTSSNQQKTMVKIVNDFTGSSRMPMIIIDCPSVIKDRNMFSARGAGILGFSIFGSKKIYALRDDMTLNVEAITEFMDTYKGQRILLFGFTFMVWQYFYRQLLKLKEQGISFDLSNGILIHGGGWKKLISEAVSPDEFKTCLKQACGIEHIHDYYGMVEQTGCIYMQCECGHLHASIFSDVIARRPLDFSVCDYGEKGILQVVSTIPESYPGHSLLTEDEGIILGEDDCPCGRKGKYFEILGRIRNAEIRGCSDTFTADRARVVEAETGNDTADIFAKADFLVGNREILDRMSNLRVLKPFDDIIVDFMDAVSGKLMHAKECRNYPDVVTLGFWLRKASVLNLKKRFHEDGNSLRTGRGMIFHIAPSNVAVNYAYSLFAALMCGNSSVVRVPSKAFPQVRIINTAISEALNSFEELKPYLVLLRYERDKKINDYLSELCDIRVIWGGDNTIAELRKSSLKPRAGEITFADRYSFSIINPEDISKSGLEQLAKDFYNDTYITDQNACTSPRVVVWLNNGTVNEAGTAGEAREIFWNCLFNLVDARYQLQPIQSVDKLSRQYETTVKYTGELKKEFSADNRLIRVTVDKLTADLMKYRGNSGFFYEYVCEDTESLRDLCNNSRCQTIGYFGDISSIRPVLESGIHGVDRVVPIGKTMDFDLLWDGYNLFESFTRIIKL